MIRFINILLVLLLFSTLKAQISPINNVIGIDITLPQNPSYTYDSAFIYSYQLGMRQIGLHFLWKSSIETSPRVYNLSFLDIANIYYPAINVPVDLNIDPIETNVLELPTDIALLSFTDTIVINRFKTLLDSIFIHIPNLELSSLVIGSEIDAYLGTDSALWAQYTSFYSIVSAYAKTLRPGLKVSCEATFPGLIGASSEYIQLLNVYSDIIGVSYYPLNGDFTVKPTNIVATDFSNIVRLYPYKPIYYYQLGYPSSSQCNSSEIKQSEFISQVFQSWDTFANNIKMIDFTWLHDWSPDAVNYWSSYYGISDTSFLAFIGSIGLKNWNGTDKQSYNELKCQAKQRGYNALSIICTNDIDIYNNNDFINIYPNPVLNELNIEYPFDIINTEIKMYNQLGQIEKDITDIKTRNIKIETSNLSNGLYFIIIQNGCTQIIRKIIIDK